MTPKPKVRTCLWMESGGLDAAKFYVSLLPGSQVETKMHFDQSEPPILVEFTLAGTPYQILSGGPTYKLSPAASISVLTEDQAETDRLWTALTAEGGQEQPCGWLVDRFGVSWQIVPEALLKCVGADDETAAERARQAMYKMQKIDIAAVEKAFRG